MNRDFQSRASQAEKAEVLRNQQALRPGDRELTTFHQLAGVDRALEGGGRFGRVEYISGSDPAGRYPPAASPWSGPQPGMEKSLG